MSDTDSEAAPALPAPAPAPRPAPPPSRPGSGVGGLALLLGVVALVASGYSAWRVFEFERSVGARADALRERQDELIRETAKLARETDRLRGDVEGAARRFQDMEAVNKSLREEILGLGERAALVEDAMASLAERRLDGATALRLNEAEFLLRLGAERLRLFGDVGAALVAFRLADAQLAGLDDALFAGVRQTLANEVAALAKLDTADVGGAMARLDAIAEAVSDLPTRAEPAADVGELAESNRGYFDRAWSVLADLVRVRRLDAEGSAFVNPLNARLLRADIALEISLAKAALVARDAQRWADTLASVRLRIAGGFAPVDRTAELLDELDRLATIPLRPVPVSIGRALDELGNLRATRALADRKPPAPAPTPAPEPVPAPVPAPPAPVPVPAPEGDPPQ